MSDSFVAAVGFWALVMGLDTPVVVDRKDLPGLRVAQVSCDAYGCLIERDTSALNYKLWNKETLALHEMCHVRYATNSHGDHDQCMREYWRRGEQRKRTDRKKTKRERRACLDSPVFSTRTGTAKQPPGFYHDEVCDDDPR